MFAALTFADMPAAGTPNGTNEGTSDGTDGASPASHTGLPVVGHAPVSPSPSFASAPFAFAFA